ncbi:translation initiation factor IF-2-like [Panicum virgatum]|uniref:translation initiation factor IF-2-like n=1 Tax=Panicum virgatum TaxID=38727 RepID=UPI0019D692D4|nr:translation initiation factor IF-2-like [Panicum virgatum]
MAARGGTARARTGAAAVEARGGATFARPGVRTELARLGEQGRPRWCGERGGRSEAAGRRRELSMSMTTRMPPGKRSRPWADLPTELVDAVVARLDVLSAARLAAVRAPWARTVAAAKPSLPFGTTRQPLHRRPGRPAGRVHHPRRRARRLPLQGPSPRDAALLVHVHVPQDRGARHAAGGVGRRRLPGGCDRHEPDPGRRAGRPPELDGAEEPPRPHGRLRRRHRARRQGLRRRRHGLRRRRHGLRRRRHGLRRRRHGQGLRLGPAARRRLAPGPGALAGGAGATSYGESVYQWNLAESADGRRLVLACTHGRYAWHEKRGRDGSTKTVHRFHGDGVRLHELDVDDDAAGGDGRRRWRPVTSLGGRALFLGANWPLWAAVTVSRGPPGQVARPNCVYVAPAVLFGYQDEDFDVVVHDLDDGSCRQIKVSDRDEDEDGFVIPIWFTPTLQMWSRRAS